MAEAFRLGKIRKILMLVFRLRRPGLVGQFRPKPGRRRRMARVISDTCFFELAAVQVAAVQGYARNLDSSGAMLKAMAIGYAGKRPMHKRNAVQLRLAFSAAAVGAVLAAATFSGAHRAGSLVRQTVRETEPVLVGSISTIKNPGGEKAGTRR
jgi:hypothetical protein